MVWNNSPTLFYFRFLLARIFFLFRHNTRAHSKKEERQLKTIKSQLSFRISVQAKRRRGFKRGKGKRRVGGPVIFAVLFHRINPQWYCVSGRCAQHNQFYFKNALTARRIQPLYVYKTKRKPVNFLPLAAFLFPILKLAIQSLCIMNNRHFQRANLQDTPFFFMSRITLLILKQA